MKKNAVRQDIAPFKLLGATMDGRIFSAVFTKKDGTKRTILARRGVKKFVNGIGMRYNPIEKGLLTVFDIHKKQYRMINLLTIQEFRVNGNTYIVH
jgi:hypothetical protein